MDEERYFALMMEALDGVLDESEAAELDQILLQHPALQQEWQMMQQVDALLRRTPPVATPVNFAERTMARLPNQQRRRVLIFGFYLLLLIGGLLPLIAALLILATSDGAPTVVDGIVEMFRILGVLATALFSALSSALATQPLAFGWLTAMVGVIVAWFITYRQLTTQVQPLRVQMIGARR